MSNIVAKLNLNKTPQLVDDNSMIFAKNIKLLSDGSIAPDSSFKEIMSGFYDEGDYGYVGQIVGNNGKIYFFIERYLAVWDEIENNNQSENKESNLDKISNTKIIEYDEINETVRNIPCAWHYSGGTITGTTTINNTNETILVVCESFDEDNNKIVPIKYININKSSYNDDETVYTQNPNVPITNISCKSKYTKSIPCGVYQFFVRYRIDKDFYTDWFEASATMFAGSIEIMNTIQGQLKYVDTNKKAGESFVLSVTHLFDNYKTLYKDYQLGFIVSSGDTALAKAWNHFDFNVTSINFEYEPSILKDVNIDDMTKVHYELYNVKNVTFFRNKLYIANYVETDFNPDLQSYADNVKVETNTKNIQTTKGYFIGNTQLIPDTDYNYLFTGYGNDNNLNTIICDNNITRLNKDSLTQFDNNIGYVSIIHIYYKDLTNVPYQSTTGYVDNMVWVNKCGTVVHINDTALFETKDYHSTDWRSIDAVSNLRRDLPEYYLSFSCTKQHPLDNIAQYKWYWVNHPEWLCTNKHTGFKDNKAYNVKLDNGNCTKLNDIKTHFRNLTQTINNKISNYYLHYIKIICDDDFYLCGDGSTIDVTISNNDVTYLNIHGTSIVNDTEETIKSCIRAYLGLEDVAVDSDGHYYIKRDNHYYAISKIEVNVSKIEKTIDESYDDNNVQLKFEGQYLTRIKQSNKVYTFNINTTSIESIKPDYYSTTFAPFEKYSFYIHYMKSNGIYTNGYHIGDLELTEGYSVDNGLINIIYPSFDNIATPPDYSSYFISYHKDSKQVCQLFNVKDIDGFIYADCIELDTGLYKEYENICIYDAYTGDLVTNNATYYSSSTTEPIEYIGTTGFIKFLKPEKFDIGHILFVVFENNKEYVNKKLSRLTPYIYGDCYWINDYACYIMPCYISNCKKLIYYNNDGSKLDDIYVSGADVYTKELNGNNNLKLNKYTNPTYTRISETNFIISDFNINYLSLTEEPVIQKREYISTDDTKIDNYDYEMFIGVNSLIASDIYQLESMYYDFYKLYYDVYDYNNAHNVIYNNTVRSSNIDVDEMYRRIYKFDATDYYNIPTNRGKIINMFSIINNIYIHTEHTLYRFSGNNSLNSDENSVTLQETDVFDTGITEIFDSQYGYGGLQRKSQSLVTYNTYLFYDSFVNKIYAYGNSNKLVDIGEPIDKIMKAVSISDVKFVSDDSNNRCFINIIADSNNICLSYNYKNQSFVSIHDFSFTNGFDSRVGTYFVTSKSVSNRNEYLVYRLDNSRQNSYFSLYKPSLLQCSDIKVEGEYNNVQSVVDIIHNSTYETIKNLEYINWICSKITSYGFNMEFVAEEVNDIYAGSKIRIYSDETNTDLINLEDTDGNPLIQNNCSITNNDAWKYPRYNCGVWSMNHFRDVRQLQPDIIPPISRTSDNMALIYGKYIVARIVFINKNFRFENITFRTNNYEKVY